MSDSEFNVGDEVLINWPGDRSNGSQGTVINKYCNNNYLIRILGFQGHSAGNCCWNVSGKRMIKLSSSTKIHKPENTETKENPMFDSAKKLIEDNKEAAIVEAERKIGLAAFEQFEKVVIQKFPGSEGFVKSPVGTLAISNVARALGYLYTGPKKELVDETTKILLRGSYAKAGDSFDLNGFVESVFESVKGVLPGTQSGDNE